jgi:hypothetical protein
MEEDESKEAAEAVEVVESSLPPGLLDKIQEKLISRKLLVFATATGLLAGAGLDSETWGMIAIVYVGGQAAIDAVRVWRHGG